jgi:transposase-like protein
MERPDLDTVACVNIACQMFRQPGQGQLSLRKVYGPAQRRLVRCHTCGEECSERRGTALCNTKLPEAKAEAVIRHLDDGCSVRATSRLVKVAKATVARRLRQAGRHAERCHERYGHGLTPQALECAAPWRVVKQSSSAATPTRWRGLAICGTTRRWPQPAHWWCASSWASGRQRRPVPWSTTAGDACGRAMSQRSSPRRTQATSRLFERPLDVVIRPPAMAPTGRLPRAGLRWPQGLAYGQGKKQEQGSRVARGDVRVRPGKARRQHVWSLLGSHQMTTSVVERHNGTSRLRKQRKVRKTLAFSKVPR